MPFRVGAKFDYSRQTFEVRQIQPGGIIRLLLNCSRVSLFLRGDFDTPYDGGLQNEPFAVINVRAGEILEQSQLSFYQNPVDGLFLQWIGLSRHAPRNSRRDVGPPPLPPHWVDDAYICFYDEEVLGNVPFEYSGNVTTVVH